MARISHLDPQAFYVSAVPVGAQFTDSDGFTGTVARTYPLGARMRCLVCPDAYGVARHRDYGVSEIVRVSNIERAPSQLIYAG